MFFYKHACKSLFSEALLKKGSELETLMSILDWLWPMMITSGLLMIVTSLCPPVRIARRWMLRKLPRILAVIVTVSLLGPLVARLYDPVRFDAFAEAILPEVVLSGGPGP